MKRKIFTLTLLLLNIMLFAQIENDTIYLNGAQIYKTPNFEDKESKIHFDFLEKKIVKVYPIFSDIYKDYTDLNVKLDSLKKKKEKNATIKQTEKVFLDKYRKKIVDLTHNEGRLLSKLMHRYTGKTTYDVIKSLKGGFAARLMNIQTNFVAVDLKLPYNPEEVREDNYTETILQKLFSTKVLIDVAKEQE